MTFKHRFTREIGLLACHCASDGSTNYHVISQPLHDALEEILEELARPRSNWRRIAALCGVKSFIADRAKRADGGKNHFWSKLNGNDGPYSVLDRLAHEAASYAHVVPAGRTEFITTEKGIGRRESDISGSSPTLTLMRQERQWIADHSKQ